MRSASKVRDFLITGMPESGAIPAIIEDTREMKMFDNPDPNSGRCRRKWYAMMPNVFAERNSRYHVRLPDLRNKCNGPQRDETYGAEGIRYRKIKNYSRGDYATRRYGF